MNEIESLAQPLVVLIGEPLHVPNNRDSMGKVILQMPQGTNDPWRINLEENKRPGSTISCTIIYIDANVRPVKPEIYKVASRYSQKVKIVANATMKVPEINRIELVVYTGFGAADDWIADHVGKGDIVITADITLAARCVDKEACVPGPKANDFQEKDIGGILAATVLLEDYRQFAIPTHGPPPMKPKDQSRFLSKLDELVNAVNR